MGHVGVVIAAAGGGTRMGGLPKQFRELGNASLLHQTSLAFERHQDVQHIVVVAPSNALSRVGELLRSISKLDAVVAGGSTRQASVACGLRALPGEVDVVLVHDAARPFIDPADIAGVIATVGRYGAAALAVPVVDTVRYAESDIFTRDVSRENLFAMQTPQGFRRAILEEAFQACATEANATDDVTLVQQCGYPVRVVPGRSSNFKITSNTDWCRAERLWPEFARVHYGVD